MAKFGKSTLSRSKNLHGVEFPNMVLPRNTKKQNFPSLRKLCLQYYNKLPLTTLKLENILTIRPAMIGQCIYESRFGRKYIRVCTKIRAVQLKSVSGVICCYHVGKGIFYLGNFECNNCSNIEKSTKWNQKIGKEGKLYLALSFF